MIKPGNRVHAEEDKQLKLNELWDSGERSGLGFSVQWQQTKLCSLTATNSAAGCQLSIWGKWEGCLSLITTWQWVVNMRTLKKDSIYTRKQKFWDLWEIGSRTGMMLTALTPEECVLWVTETRDHLEGTITPGTVRKECSKWNKYKTTVEMHGYTTS